jgi:ribulose-5-phosphate 4-epimerase/fuculose-1-phosphate aldolase
MLEMSAESRIKDDCSAEEWSARVDLAACYRLVAHYGWDDLIFTHLSAKVPGTHDHFLINPYGLRFDEVTASNLVKIDLDGNKLDDSPHDFNYPGFIIHSAIHMSRDDAMCVMHLHTIDNVAVSTMEEGLLPYHQTALLIADQIAYHDFEGFADDLAERDRLAEDLGDKCLMLLRNHGTLVVGPTVGITFMRAYLLERSCEMQMRMLAANRPLVIPTEQAVSKFAGVLTSDAMCEHSQNKGWPAARRILEQTSPGYDI